MKRIKRRKLWLGVLIGVPLAFFAGNVPPIMFFPFGLLGSTLFALIGWSTLIICVVMVACTCTLLGKDDEPEDPPKPEPPNPPEEPEGS